MLHSPLSHLWSHAQRCAQTSQPLGAFLRTPKLQKQLTDRVEESLFDRHNAGCTRYQQTVLTALSQTRGSSAYLTVLPTQPAYRMASADFRLAVRHRLGLVPFDSLLPLQCRLCTRHPPLFAEDPDHFHSCDKLRRSVCTARHSNLMAVLMDLARSVGFYASREPNDHIRPQAVEADRDASTKGVERYNAHADILLLKHDQRLYVDVTVTRPTMATLLQHPRVALRPLVSAEVRARAKHAKYGEIAKLNGYDLYPFAVETYGGLGVEAQRLLMLLSQHSRELSPKQFLAHAPKRISVTLQASNAQLQQSAVHTHSIDQSRWKRNAGRNALSFRLAQDRAQTQSRAPTGSRSAAGAAAVRAKAKETQRANRQQMRDDAAEEQLAAQLLQSEVESESEPIAPIRSHPSSPLLSPASTSSPAAPVRRPLRHSLHRAASSSHTRSASLLTQSASQLSSRTHSLATHTHLDSSLQRPHSSTQLASHSLPSPPQFTPLTLSPQLHASASQPSAPSPANPSDSY